MNIDYSICNAITQAANGIDDSLIIYDVRCQWNLHFTECVEDCPGLALSDNTCIVTAVGKFHLSAHKLPCFARYSLNFILGAGQVDGEILETLWAPFNKISPTAQSLNASKVKAWEEDEEKAMKDRGEYLDIYQLNIDKAPIMAEIRLKLTESEYVNTGKLGSVSWLVNGIHLEDSQYIMKQF
ncbi:uncharacterized protein F5891DRAFT_950353 [Suillus fuscotomentosus]|uniref:Uncharacterized protein n=1 Tax=Suillus fuscotomentosus TaxID=1912939 RepID=A0AAD4E8N0_9AGAM|nr:uncharacterized protein F5891DRAFT_950353 [Suillus fuscotomentosus]KAG1901610.1 hypothetical protein F5891DRAFT_950353 [Suillus fuscotomentosus]